MLLKMRKNYKSQGNDDIPWEFCRIYYKDISILHRRSLNVVFSNKNLSITQK